MKYIKQWFLIKILCEQYLCVDLFLLIIKNATLSPYLYGRMVQAVMNKSEYIKTKNSYRRQKEAVHYIQSKSVCDIIKEAKTLLQDICYPIDYDNQYEYGRCVQLTLDYDCRFCKFSFEQIYVAAKSFMKSKLIPALYETIKITGCEFCDEWMIGNRYCHCGRYRCFVNNKTITLDTTDITGCALTSLPY